jgi:hypothetical protein
LRPLRSAADLTLVKRQGRAERTQRDPGLLLELMLPAVAG